MGFFQADANKVVYLPESGTYATPSGVSGGWIGLVTNHEPTESQGVTEIRYAGQASRNVSQFVDGPRDYEGTITYHPQNFIMLGYALGSMVDTSGTISTHTLSETNSINGNGFTSGTLNPFMSFTVVDQHQTNTTNQHLIRKYQGAVVDSWSLSASEGEPVECEVSYRAKSLVTGSATTALVPTLNEQTFRPFLWSDVKVHIPSGTVYNTVKEVNFSVNNNLAEKHYIGPGSREIEISVPINRDYELTLTADATANWAQTLYDSYWNGGSTFNMILEVNAAANRNALIYLSGCKLTEFGAPSPAEGIDEFSLTIKPQIANAVVSDVLSKYNPW